MQLISKRKNRTNYHAHTKLHTNPTILFLLLNVVFTQFIFGQTNELDITEYTVIDGVRLGKINSIAQDANGFLWLSDQGNRALLRYDGKHVKKYQYDPNDPDSPDKLGGYYPECFFIEESGVIWIGFYGQGLDRFDPNTNTFTHFNSDPGDPQSLSNDFVAALEEDSKGNLWIATYGGLNRLDRQTGIFTRYQNISENKNSLSCDTVRALYLDNRGTLWAGTGLAWDLESDRGGLNKYNPASDDFTIYRNDPSDKTSLINNKVRSIFEDSRGTFWIGTGGDGLHTMDRERGTFARHTYDPANPEKLSRPPLGNPNDRITFIREDSKGYIWIGTDANGVNRYNPETGRVQHITEFFQNGAWWMHVAQDDQVWITTNRAQLIRINLYRYSISNVSDRLNFIVEESPDIHWVGTNQGIYKLNKLTGEKIYLDQNDKDVKSLCNATITYMLMDSEGILWVGTWMGLFKVIPETGKVKHYPNFREDSNEFSNNVTSMVESDNKTFWIGTDNGMERFDSKNETFTYIGQDFTNSNSLNGFIVTDLEEGKDNTLWISLAANRGLNKLDVKSDTFDLYLHGLNVFELYTDSKGVLWTATEGGGLFQYDQDTDQFIPTEISGNVASIFEDESFSLWVSTMDGVFKLNQDRDHFSFFESHVEELDDGIFENVGVSYMQDDKLYMGHWLGYYVIDPDNLVDHPYTTHVVVSEIHANDISNNKSLLYSFAPSINSITLNQEQNSFSISFSETDFQENVDDNIYFLLENYDTDWRKIQPGELMDYYKVPTGSYRLRMKASSKSGAWTEHEFQITVLPPWWFTKWAYAGYGMIFIFGIFSVHKVQKANTIRKERERIKDRELEQARRVEQAYEELKATQEQLVQSEKMASLGELTAGIAHEIQNPLNFVNNFAEVNKELIEELRDAVASNDQEEIQVLLKDLAGNEEKIKHHGRRAEGIVKSMLQHSRGSEGKKEFVDLNSLCDEYLRLAYHGFRAKDKSFNADFKTDFDTDLPKVNIVPQDIGRVLLNLINNAFQAVNNVEKPTIVISTQRVNDQIKIGISDNGSGIPDEIKDKVFQPFFTTKPTGSGTGLGLSLSYDIVKVHGGDLTVESKTGEGTNFKVTLPIKA